MNIPKMCIRDSCWTDSAQHGRQSYSENARMSGRVDPCRTKKQSFDCFRVMQSEAPAVKIIGHWNYPALTAANSVSYTHLQNRRPQSPAGQFVKARNLRPQTARESRLPFYHKSGKQRRPGVVVFRFCDQSYQNVTAFACQTIDVYKRQEIILNSGIMMATNGSIMASSRTLMRISFALS